MDRSFWVGVAAGAVAGAGILYTLQQGAWRACVPLGDPPALPPPLSRTLLTKGMQSLLPLVIYTLFLALAAPQEPLPLMRL